jgi:hypothetical protein
MKRFGGIEFISYSNSNSINLLDATVIDQLRNLIIRANQSALMIDAAKTAALFQIHPPQVSVLSFFYYHLFENKRNSI